MKTEVLINNHFSRFLLSPHFLLLAATNPQFLNRCYKSHLKKPAVF
jgi:hypothetical protein